MTICKGIIVLYLPTYRIEQEIPPLRDTAETYVHCYDTSPRIRCSLR